MIEFNNVDKVYSNGTRALKNINLKIGKGEFVFLIGQSGAGKSSLIKLIMKEEDVTSGSLIVNKVDTKTLKQKDVPNFRRGVGTVFQDFRLLPEKTVYQNVAYALEITEKSPRIIRREVPKMLALVGLMKKAKVYPKQLSGGEQQRVAIARALINKPAILIADEPTGNLDPDTSREIMDLINDVNIMGTTVIVSTHEKGIVNRMMKRVIVVENGEITRDEQKGQYDEI